MEEIFPYLYYFNSQWNEAVGKFSDKKDVRVFLGTVIPRRESFEDV